MGFDPSSAQPISSGFDPSSATPEPSGRSQGATGFGMIGQTIGDLFNHTGQVNHDPNALEQGIMNLGNSPVVKSLTGSYEEGITNGLFMQPVRAVMEASGYGLDRVKQLYPNQSDDFYKQKLHDFYNQAITNARQKASFDANTAIPADEQDGSRSLGNLAARGLQQVGNFGANMLAQPEMLLMGGAGTGSTALARIGSAAAKNAGIGALSDAAAQGMDLIAGQKKNFDITQNLQNAAGGAVVGGVMHGVTEAAPVVSDFVKGLFGNRGRDTTPPENPTGTTAPLTGNSPIMTPEQRTQFGQVMRTGSVDDIKNFLEPLQGPKPSYQDVDKFVQFRDQQNATLADQQNFDPQTYDQAVDNKQALEQHIDQTISDHQQQLVQDHIDAQTANWRNKPDIEVVQHSGQISDPVVRQQAIDEGVDVNKNPGFIGQDGKVRIFSDRVTSPDQLNGILYHEALGHYGLEQQFGSGLDKMLDTLYARNVGGFRADVDKWKAENPGAYGGSTTRAAEEVLAERSQNGALKPTQSQALVSTIRRFGRRMGLDLAYSDAEVDHILAQAHDAVINGKGTNAANNGFKTGSPDYSNPYPKGMWKGETANKFMRKDAFEAKEDSDKDEIQNHYGESLNSDSKVSKDAQRLWEASGATRNPEAIVDPYDGSLSTQDSSSVYSGPNKFITAKQAAATDHNAQLPYEEIERTYHMLDEGYTPTYKSQAETRRDAIEAGINPSQVNKLGQGGDLAVRAYRMQAAAKIYGQNIADILEKVGTPELTAGDLDRLREQTIKQYALLSKIRDENAEMARALNIAKLGYNKAMFESFGEMLKAEGGTFAGLGDHEQMIKFANALKQVVADGKNPNGVNAMVKGLGQPHWEDYLTTLHQNFMLSALSTHVKAPQDMMIGIGRELLQSIGAQGHTAGVAALNAMGANLKPGVHPVETAARLWGVLKAAMDANTYRNTVKTFMSKGVNPNGFGGNPRARIPGVSMVTDAISAHDAFFRAFAMNMHLYGLAARDVAAEFRAGTNPMLKNWDDMMTKISNVARKPTPTMLREAQDASNKTLLLNSNTLNRPLDAIKNKAYLPGATAGDRAAAFIANFLAPFVRVEANSLYTRVIRNSPLTILDPATYKELKAGGEQAGLAMARIAMGVATFASAWFAYDHGKLTGAGPDNPDKRKELEATGWRPNAVHENGQYNTGNKLGSSLNPLDIHNSVSSMVADFKQSLANGANKGQVLAGVKLGLLSVMKDMAQSSWIGDIAPAVNALTAPNTTIVQKGEQFLGSETATMIPSFIAQGARITDQNQPDLKEHPFTGPILAAIPGARQSLPVQQDVYGNPVQGGASFAGQHSFMPQDNRITGGNHVNEVTDQAIQEMHRLSSLMGDKALVTPVSHNITISDPSKFDKTQITDNGNGTYKVKLNEQQIQEYQHLVGQNIVAYVRQEMQSPQWAQMSDNDKAYEVKDIEKDMKKAIKEQLYGQ
jgi:hypothetical protein